MEIRRFADMLTGEYLVDAQSACAILGVTNSTLSHWKEFDSGPIPVCDEGQPLYSESELYDWKNREREFIGLPPIYPDFA